MNMEPRLRERQDYFFALSLFYYWIFLKDKTRREQNRGGGGDSTFRTRNYLEFIHIQQSWREKAISIGFVDGTFKGKLAKVT